MDLVENYLPQFNTLTNNKNIYEFASINNYFDLKFSPKLQKNNFFYSPFTISFMLCLLYIGSTEETKDEISNFLGIENNSEDKKIIKTMFNIYYQLLNSRLVNIGNAFFINNNYFYDIKPYFLSLMKKNNVVVGCNFLDEGEKIIYVINKWVNQITKGIINEIITSNDITGETQMINIGINNFTTKWLYNFNEEYTKIDKFLKLDYGEIELPMMRQKNIFPYYQTPHFQLIELPFKDTTFSMGFFLPKEEGKFINHLFSQYICHLQDRHVEIIIPKFIQNYKVENVVKTLRKMGLIRLFEIGYAELYNMIQELDGLCLDNIYHQNIIEVNEGGKYTPHVSSKGIYTKFIANHSFQYYIRHIPTETILFHGVF